MQNGNVVASGAAAKEPFTERNAYAELVTWSEARPLWQRDALRRLVVNGELTAADIEELSELCLDSTRPSQPLTTAQIAQEVANAEDVALVRIDNPKGVNALAAGQTLTFAPTGLTIIYGDNGSGKSGFVRVLKHACRSRDSGRAILPDVGNATPVPQSAKIVFARGGAEHDYDWTPSSPANPDLPSVSIFDSRSANIHVEKTNEVAYIPAPMQVLEQLAAACDLVKAKLEGRTRALAAQRPQVLRATSFGIETAAGAFMCNLNAKSNVAQLNLLANMTDGDRTRLAMLEGDLAQDPQRAAQRLRQHRQKLEQGGAKLKRAVEASNAAAFARRDALKLDHDTKQAAALTASTRLFASAPLPDIGQNVWKALWEAARAYSNAYAYPGNTFPDGVADDTKCVLCQQPLSTEALDRFATFEGFVKGTTKADEDTAAEVLASAQATSAAAGMPMSGVADLSAFVKTDIGDSGLADKIRHAGVIAGIRQRSLVGMRPAPSIVAEDVFTDITAACDQLQARADQLAADNNSPARKALVLELQGLKDRAALAPLLDDIKAEIARRIEADRIEDAIKDCAKKPVTTQNKVFSDKLVTNALRGRFAREVEKLQISGMPIELRKERDKDAVSYFKVCLVETPSRPVGEIFSEGEHRCVALAAFMGELVTSKRKSGIVFDDPMSSLDHIHRKAVAGRLVEEAAHRQVVVFTHDLTFLFELRRQTEVKGQDVHYQTIRRRQDRPGYVEDDLPTKGKSANQLISALRHELKETKGKFDGMKDMARTLFCKGVIEQLREAWEQAIADVVWPVLQRFDNQIKGGTFYKLAVITDADVLAVTAARSRLSEDLHASAQTLNPGDITHAGLCEEVDKLEAWTADIMKRQSDAKKPAVG